MKKIFTLLLTLFMVGSVYAENRVLYIGETAIANWDASVTISSNLTSSISANDVLLVGFEYNPSNSGSSDYPQIKISGNSTEITSIGDLKGNFVSYTMTDVSNIKGKELKLEGSYVKICFVSVIHDTPTTTNLVTGLSHAVGDWTNTYTVETSNFNNVNVGDVLVLNITGTSAGSQGALQDKSTNSWNVRYGNVDINGQTSYEVLVTKSVLAYYKSAGATATGKNYTLNSIAVKNYDYQYQFNKDVTPSLTDYPVEAIDVEFARAFSAGWNSICLPFNATVSSIDSGAELFEFTGGDNSKVVVTKKDGGAMVAGTPYLVKMGSAKSENTTFTNVTVSATTAGCTSAFGGVTFHGNYTAGMNMENNYGVAYDSSAWKIMKGGSGSKLPAFCAYFTGTPAASSRGFSIEEGDGTTGIDAFENVEVEETGPVYNLMGQQITTPRKGLYIKNGKKYLAK